MSVYQVDYDLRRPGQNYEKLHDKIKSVGDTHHGTESTFFVKTDMSAKRIRDELSEVVDSNDTIIVAIIGENSRPRWATSSGRGAGTWLDENL